MYKEKLFTYLLVNVDTLTAADTKMTAEGNLTAPDSSMINILDTPMAKNCGGCERERERVEREERRERHAALQFSLLGSPLFTTNGNSYASWGPHNTVQSKYIYKRIGFHSLFDKC